MSRAGWCGIVSDPKGTMRGPELGEPAAWQWTVRGQGGGAHSEGHSEDLGPERVRQEGHIFDEYSTSASAGRNLIDTRVH